MPCITSLWTDFMLSMFMDYVVYCLVCFGEELIVGLFWAIFLIYSIFYKNHELVGYSMDDDRMLEHVFEPLFIV